MGGYCDGASERKDFITKKCRLVQGRIITLQAASYTFERSWLSTEKDKCPDLRSTKH
jgi:hypothetical protein